MSQTPRVEMVIMTWSLGSDWVVCSTVRPQQAIPSTQSSSETLNPQVDVAPPARRYCMPEGSPWMLRVPDFYDRALFAQPNQ